MKWKFLDMSGVWCFPYTDSCVKWKLKGSLESCLDGDLLGQTQKGTFCQSGHRYERLRKTQKKCFAEADTGGRMFC